MVTFSTKQRESTALILFGNVFVVKRHLYSTLSSELCIIHLAEVL